METPRVPVNFVPVAAGETFALGTVIIRVMEDGSRTDNRLGVAEFTVPAHTPGPIAHWHESGLRFHLLDGALIDASTGDFVTVPTRAVHTFSNPHADDAKFIGTFTPANYINYFKMLSTMVKAGTPMTAEANRRAMAYFATIGVAEEEMKTPEERDKAKTQ